MDDLGFKAKFLWYCSIIFHDYRLSRLLFVYLGDLRNSATPGYSRALPRLAHEDTGRIRLGLSKKHIIYTSS